MLEELMIKTGLSRREVLHGLVILGVIPSVNVGCVEVINDILEAIANRPTRRNIGSLSDTDDIIVAYQDGVTKMKALPSSDPRNWENFAEIHYDYCPHSNWLFLPWHRHYLYWFERIIRDLSGMPDWALPYWNWLEDPDIPSVFLSGDLSHFRSSTSVFVSGDTCDTAMSQTSFVNFGSGALASGADQRDRTTKATFESSVHDTVHSQIGGSLADGMRSFRSPRDPIFWLHHNMVELMWVEWNLGLGNLNPSDVHWVDFSFSGQFTDETSTSVTGSEAAISYSLLFPLVSYQFENSLVGTVMSTL